MGSVVASLPLAIVLSLMLFGYLSELHSAAQQAPACGDERMQELARAQMFDGLDSAFQDHVAGLYAVWLREKRAGQPRAAAGVDLGVSAYIHGRQAIEQWRLRRC